jgi:hypothetical protein
MPEPFLLCDPGLMLPPEGDSVERYQEFWRRLVAWSADRRVQLGLQGHDAVVRHLNSNGWPNYEPPHCPDSLRRDAFQAVNRLIGAGVREPNQEAKDIPDLDPEYTRDAECGAALALDLVEQHDESLVAAATHASHWLREAASVSLEPPPPPEVALAFEPNVRTDAERCLRAGEALNGMRLKIVGGMRKPAVEAEIEERLSFDLSKLVWLEAEKGSQPPLDRFKGMRPDVDVLVCVTGKIGHAASEKARDLAVAAGIEPVLVEKASEILAALEARFGQ